MNERNMTVMVGGIYYILTAWEAEEDYVTCTDIQLLSEYAKENDQNKEDVEDFLDSDPIAPSFDSTERALAWGKRIRF